MKKYDYNRARVYGCTLQVKFTEKLQQVEHTGQVLEKKPNCLVFADGRKVFRSRIVAMKHL